MLGAAFVHVVPRAGEGVAGARQSGSPCRGARLERAKIWLRRRRPGLGAVFVPLNLQVPLPILEGETAEPRIERVSDGVEVVSSATPWP
jgi:hypothetical protein